MELNKFIRRGLNRGATFSHKVRGMDFKTCRELAELTKFAEFGCEFDKAGRCKNYKSVPPGELVMCCCNSCFYETGYLRTFPTGGWCNGSRDKLKDLKTYARHFSEKTIIVHGNKRQMGFWRPGKGCVLPRAHRSATCLTYTCGQSDKLSDWEKQLFRLINGYIEFPIALNNKMVKYNEGGVVAGMIKWREELNDKHKNK